MRSTRLLVLALSLVIAACGRDASRPAARTPHDSARAAAAPIDTVDGCEQTGGTRPDTSIALGSEASERWMRALARGAEFRCVITPAMEMRFVIAGDTTLPSLDSILVYASAASGRLVQVLSVPSGVGEMPAPYIPNLLRAIDLDADGYRDLMMGTSWGATGNTSYAVWRFDPRARRFVADSVLSEQFNPEPVPGRACVRTSSNSSARDNSTGLYCLHEGRWLVDSAEQDEWDRVHDAVIHSILARRDDSLVVVKRETLPDSS